jgi:CRP/FNR family cyclic AMP-dependent transcriptional regulator
LAGAGEADFRRALRNAVRAGPFARLPEPELALFLGAGVRVDLPQRTVYLHEGAEVRPALVVSGLLRASIRGPDGRQISVSYMRPGDVVGFTGLFGGPLSAAVESVGPVALFAFSPEIVSSLLERDPPSLRLFAKVVTLRLYAMVGELTLHVFGTVRERVCHHLLDLAMEGEPEGPLIANVTQQQLADAAGTARESVARVLSSLEAEGLIERSGKRVLLREPLLMHPAHEHWQEHRQPIG